MSTTATPRLDAPTLASTISVEESCGFLYLVLRDHHGHRIAYVPVTEKEGADLATEITAKIADAHKWDDSALTDAYQDAATVNALAEAWAAGQMQP